jgi:hypothetical protein
MDGLEGGSLGDGNSPSVARIPISTKELEQQSNKGLIGVPFPKTM